MVRRIEEAIRTVGEIRRDTPVRRTFNRTMSELRELTKSSLFKTPLLVAPLEYLQIALHIATL